MACELQKFHMICFRAGAEHLFQAVLFVKHLPHVPSAFRHEFLSYATYLRDTALSAP